jgi:lipopolysaccharide/colanic/teichoic acid biosynthesis glycosyltransferase
MHQSQCNSAGDSLCLLSNSAEIWTVRCFGRVSLNTEAQGQQVLESWDSSSYGLQIVHVESDEFDGGQLRTDHRSPSCSEKAGGAAREFCDVRTQCELVGSSIWKKLSPWSASAAKRMFDFTCVLLSLPALVPLMLVVGAAVRFTSRGPVFFLQERMGRHGRPFTILKFRSMVHVADRAHHPITTSDNQRFTLVGPFLRKWKLDELPQLINVLLGHMSLVGPRPKMREHVVVDLPCRPGITGMATVIFAGEEAVLARIPASRLDAFYHAVVLPAKRKLDAEYMAQATFFSDLRLIVKSALHRWDSSVLDSLFATASLHMEGEMLQSKSIEMRRTVTHWPATASAARPTEVEEVTAV